MRQVRSLNHRGGAIPAQFGQAPDDQRGQVRTGRSLVLFCAGIVRRTVATILGSGCDFARMLDGSFNLESGALMIPRVLEPEVMDSAEEAADYNAMDHTAVNVAFVEDLLQAMHAEESRRAETSVLDVGTGTALIPIELQRCGFAGSVAGIDLADEMLKVASQNMQASGATNIRLQRIDAKSLPFTDQSFDVVMSNSIVHHIPDPADTLAEMARVLRCRGLLFVRDLLRPSSTAEIETLVGQYAGQESPRQQQLFRQSLHASLTLSELGTILGQLGISAEAVQQSSDRHWTLIWRRPGTV